MKHLMALFISMTLMATTSLWAAETINIAISSSPNNLVPFYSTDANSQNINRLVHSSLVDFNETMQFVCIACETYQESMIGQKHAFTFDLKKNLTFSDGSALSAQDVLRSYEYYAKNKDIKSTFMGAYESIEEVKVLGPLKVQIIYKNFSLENLSNLSLLKILKINSKELSNLDVQNIVGAGQYVLTKVTPLEIVAEPRDKSKPTLVFKVVKDETTLALKLINKEIDLSTATLSPRKINWLREQKGIRILERPSGNFQFMGINHKRDNFKDLRVRRAISFLLPREDILKYKLKDTAVLSVGMFSPAFKDYYEPAEVDKHDVEMARKLLTEAGWTRNKNGFLEKTGKIFEIDWKVSNNKASIEIVEVFQNYLEKEGIKVNITVQEWGTYMSAFKAGQFDIVVGQWVGFTGPDMLSFIFHSKNTPPKGGNRIGYSNPKVDELLDLATVETNETKRTNLYKNVLRMVNEDYAYINLWHPNIIWVSRDCLSPIELESSGSFYPLLKLEKRCGK